MQRFSVIILFLAGIHLSLLSAPGLELRLRAERLDLKANGERLHEILEAFLHAGVEVHVEPGIDARVSGSLEDVAVEEAMGTLLEAFNHILFWEVVEGPVGPLTRLAEIHVFRPGSRAKVKPLAPPSSRSPLQSLTYLPDELLVGVRPGTSGAQFKAMLESLGAVVVSSIPELGIYRLRLPRGTDLPAVVESLGKHPWVSRAEPNFLYRMEKAFPTREGGSPVKVTAPSPPPEGAAPLAIFDSGLAALPALKGVVAGTFDAVDPDAPMQDPVGHGTQMALIASGAVVPGGVNEGTQPGSVPLFAVRAFDQNGTATNYGMLRGIQYAVDQGVKVINMSWGSETDSQFLRDAIAHARASGILLVASAGNEPVNRPLYPAAYPGVLAVSALQADGTIWPSSNYGDFISLAAPGTGSFPVGYQGPPGAYSGTSIASAYVARVLTLYLGGNPGALSGEEVVDRLTRSLSDAGARGRDPVFGEGVLDPAAVERFMNSP